jgi:ribonuclease Z
LGSSSALPTSQRNTTAQLINHAERFFLVDCGEGTQIQMRRFQKKFFRIDHIFISHLHGDHFFGLPGLINTFNLLGRGKDLHIYAPPLLQEFLDAIRNYIFHGLSYKIIFHPIEHAEGSQLIYENKLLEVYAFPLIHKIPTYGFLFQEKLLPRKIKKELVEKYQIPIVDILKIKEKQAGFRLEDGSFLSNEELTLPPEPPRSYAFCSDTAFNPKLTEYIREVDLLYHEATFLSDMKDRAKETTHSTAEDAAKIATMVKAHRLMVGHYSSRYRELEPFRDEIMSHFSGEVLLAEDGQTIEI